MLKKVFLIATILPGIALAKSTLENRVVRLENIVDSQYSTEVLNELESIRQELNELRGNSEQQQQDIKRLQEQNLELTNKLYNSKTEDKIDNQDSGSNAQYNEAKNMYNKAYALVGKKEFAAAQTALLDFIWQYPDSNLVPNAHYWLGEVSLSQWQENKANEHLLLTAKEAFTTVVNRYPQSHKAVDCLLKLGLLAADNSQWEESKSFLLKVKQDYPSSSKVRIAEAKLKKLVEHGRIKYP